MAEHPEGTDRRTFLAWLGRIACAGTGAGLAVEALPLTRLNAAFLRDTALAAGCAQDVCTTRDQCASGDAGHTCTEKDICDVDASGDCTRDECGKDQSLACTDDHAGCASGDSTCSDEDSPGDDSSGACTSDTCRVDSSGECTGDQCLEDSSGECPAGDQCTSDSSRACQSADACTTDKSSLCTAHDSCTTDRSGDCAAGDTCDTDASAACDAGDTCIEDSSGECTNRDVCVADSSSGCGSDLCRADQSPSPCAASDTCALDLAANPVSDRRTLAQAALREALRILYGLAGLLFLLGLPPTALAAPILATGSAMLPAPSFQAGAAVPAIAAKGPFLRDCDHDGVLEADVNADGLCAGDPEVRDYDADGSRELPEGTIFEGTKAYTCFFVPADVAIVASGELTILASREAAVFGAVRAPAGFSLKSPRPIDLRGSAWLASEGYSLEFATALSSGGPANPPAPEAFLSLCESCRAGVGRLLLLLLQ